MKRLEARPVADRDQRRLGQRFAQQGHERRLARLVEGRGGFVENDDGRLLQEQAREGEALALAARQDLVPALDLVEAAREMAQPDIAEHGRQRRIRDRQVVGRIEQRLAQGPERQVGPLRHEGDGRAGRDGDAPRSPRPEAGDGAHERALADAGIADEQHLLAGHDDRVGIADQDLPGTVGHRQAGDLDAPLGRLHQGDAAHRPVEALVELVGGLDQLHDAPRGGVPLRQGLVVVDEPGEGQLHLHEGGGELRHRAERQVAGQDISASPAGAARQGRARRRRW